MQQIFVGMGSNINREKNIQNGIAALKNTFGDLLLSSVYETISHGFDGENFYNLVIGFLSDESAESIFCRLREIECKYGKIQKHSK